MSDDVHKSDVLTPTASSVIFGLLGLTAALFFVVLPRLGGDALLGLLFGKDASHSLISSSKDDYGPILEHFLNNDLLGRAVVFGVWMFVGLCVFVMITSFMAIFSTISEQKREMGYVHQNKDRLLREDLLAVSFRIGIAALWAGFTSLCIRYVLSYFAVTGFVAFGDGTLADWGIFGIAALVLYLALHMQIVFARLLVGRTRIWGS